jgi:hypothetical protein
VEKHVWKAMYSKQYIQSNVQNNPTLTFATNTLNSSTKARVGSMLGIP